MKIQLSEHFSYKKLLQFTFSSIVMMIIISMYSVVDGLFVSNLVGDMAFSSVNVVMPVSMIIGAFGFMLGNGGSAIVAKTLGEQKKNLANQYFSMIVAAVAICAIVLSTTCIIFMKPIMYFSGASDLLINDCIHYGNILIAGSLFFMLQTTLQSFLIVAEKPQLGLIVTILAGVTNMVLDYVFIKLLHLGIVGAAFATVAGYCVGGLIPFFYFLFGKNASLRLVRPKFYGRILLNACANGSSEMMNNVATSVVSILFNLQLMRLIGESGIAAYGVMMYVDFIFLAVFFGFSMGSGPIISYHYGAGNHKELANLYQKCTTIIIAFSLAMLLIAQLLCNTLCSIFVGYNKELYELTSHGFRIFALNYIFCGINTFASAFFTALCNGKISAFISFIRSFLLRGGCVIILPIFFVGNGIWMSVVIAEFVGAIFSLFFMITKRKFYHYDTSI